MMNAQHKLFGNSFNKNRLYLNIVVNIRAKEVEKYTASCMRLVFYKPSICKSTEVFSY